MGYVCLSIINTYCYYYYCHYYYYYYYYFIQQHFISYLHTKENYKNCRKLEKEVAERVSV